MKKNILALMISVLLLSPAHAKEDTNAISLNNTIREAGNSALDNSVEDTSKKKKKKSTKKSAKKSKNKAKKSSGND